MSRVIEALEFFRKTDEILHSEIWQMQPDSIEVGSKSDLAMARLLAKTDFSSQCRFQEAILKQIKNTLAEGRNHPHRGAKHPYINDQSF